MRPSISLCMIVRDEEANIADCLASVAGLVDQIIVADTGSTDRTREIAAECGAQVVDFAWIDDFAAARNEARRHATGQWIFWLDADDRISAENRQRLEALFNGLTDADREQRVGFLLSCASHCGSDAGPSVLLSHIRLFPNLPELAWTGRVHECVLPSDGRPMSLRDTQIVIDHLGYMDAAIWYRKQQRDLRLMQVEHAINPDNLTNLFYLGRAHLAMGESAEAARFLRRAIRRSASTDLPWRRVAYAHLAECLQGMKNVNGAMASVEEGLACYPDDRELLFRRGQMLAAHGRLPEAEACFARLVQLPPPDYLLWGVSAGLQHEQSYYMLGRICFATGRVAEAEQHYKAAVARQPGYVDAWVWLGLLQGGQKRKADLEETLRGLAPLPEGKLLGQVLRAYALLMEGRLRDARLLLEPVIAAAPAMLLAHMVLSDVLFAEASNWDRCIAEHQKVLELDPSQEATRARLQQIMATRQRAGSLQSSGARGLSQMVGAGQSAAARR